MVHAKQATGALLHLVGLRHAEVAAAARRVAIAFDELILAF
jgi:hypothetical protein